MPRKKLIYTHELPYHITARSNNKEWFYLPKLHLWDIFIRNINHITKNYGFKCHEFILMDNHYHLIGSTSTDFLGHVFCVFQKSVSREINKQTGRVNHVFGGPYRPSIIKHSMYYFHVYKYLYRNPVVANLVISVEDYKFSTLENNNFTLKQPVTSKPLSGLDCFIPEDFSERMIWLNEDYSNETHESIQLGLKKTEFKVAYRPQR